MTSCFLGEIAGKLEYVLTDPAPVPCPRTQPDIEVSVHDTDRTRECPEASKYVLQDVDLVSPVEVTENQHRVGLFLAIASSSRSSCGIPLIRSPRCQSELTTSRGPLARGDCSLFGNLTTPRFDPLPH
jgi:hypothetical protein